MFGEFKGYTPLDPSKFDDQVDPNSPIFRGTSRETSATNKVWDLVADDPRARDIFTSVSENEEAFARVLINLDRRGIPIAMPAQIILTLSQQLGPDDSQVVHDIGARLIEGINMASGSRYISEQAQNTFVQDIFSSLHNNINNARDPHKKFMLGNPGETLSETMANLLDGFTRRRLASVRFANGEFPKPQAKSVVPA